MKSVRIAGNTRIDIETGGEYYSEVDCRLLFLGEHYKVLMQVYKDVVRCFSESNNPAELFKCLKSSSLIQKYYEIQKTGEKVGVVLRDSIFRKPVAVDDLKLILKISNGSSVLTYPVFISELSPLGLFFPLLNGSYTETEIRLAIVKYFEANDAEWAIDILTSMREGGFLEKATATNYFTKSSSRPQVFFLGHSSLLLQSEKSAVLVDPLLLFKLGLPATAYDLTRLGLGAICCSHSHWDHCNIQTLMLFDKKTPVIIPKISRPSCFNPPIAGVLRMLGFTDIREVEPWKPIRIEDIEIIPIPFHGEQDEPGIEVDHYTYVLKTNGLSLYGGVDSYRDTFGDMSPVLEEVGGKYRPDLAFLPVSKMIYDYKYGGVNGFCRYFDKELLNSSFQYTAGPEDAVEWFSKLGARLLVPYATFTFSRWEIQKVVAQLESNLRDKDLERCLYPLRPLDSLNASDLVGARLSLLRRRALLMQLRAGNFFHGLKRGLKRRLRRPEWMRRDTG